MLKPRVYEESRPDLTSVSTLAADGTLTCYGEGWGLSEGWCEGWCEGWG